MNDKLPPPAPTYDSTITTAQPPKGIYAAIAAAMQDIGPIGKTQTADTGKFKYTYRGIEDVYNKVHPIMVKHGIMSRSETLDVEVRTVDKMYNGKVDGKESIVLWSVRYYFFCADGSEIPTDVIAEGKDPSDKAAGKAMSYAHKYAICQMFSIPFEGMPDTDTGKPDVDEPDASLRDRVLDMIAKATDEKTLAGYEHRATTMVQSDEMTAGAWDTINKAIAAKRSLLQHTPSG